MFDFSKTLFTLLTVSVLLSAAFSVSAQKRKPKASVKKPAGVSASNTKTPAAASKPIPEPPKKNERPVSQDETTQAAGNSNRQKFDPVYRYEFTQPEFLVSRVIIEHDESGKGSISFMKRGYDELITDPIEVSQTTLDKLNAAFAALNFVDSAENYQLERDFSHLGNTEIRLKKDGRTRTAKYNWTSNKDAKFLMDEYRRIGNQFIWIFDVTLARDNQPLESPRLFDSFDSMMKRNEISDPEQMVPFLQALSNDERIPLLGRNHAGKIIRQIEKAKEKGK